MILSTHQHFLHTQILIPSLASTTSVHFCILFSRANLIFPQLNFESSKWNRTLYAVHILDAFSAASWNNWVHFKSQITLLSLIITLVGSFTSSNHRCWRHRTFCWITRWSINSCVTTRTCNTLKWIRLLWFHAVR